MREKERSFPMRIRIAVGRNEKGEWVASGCHGATDTQVKNEARWGLGLWVDVFWIEADIPDPEPTPTIEGRVSQ
jgi:hypothetical protein